ncbi:MAG: hypothetical protein AVDCRST_MAG52-2304 [uncultured Blastococcus sp.]|uniref:Uncharacterized protein n=1 Tax=uncultured Blastococcus sp. TaxID=217144 RepID=A0A6J4IMP4_9ACTN|nr:MAG: hypothetical protein AVDCRST_MAG52-2304 [uncultured Blastococcus sp.]
MSRPDKSVPRPAPREPRTSEFEKRGGYPSPDRPVGQLPKVRRGPGPGGARPSEIHPPTGKK